MGLKKQSQTIHNRITYPCHFIIATCDFKSKSTSLFRAASLIHFSITTLAYTNKRAFVNTLVYLCIWSICTQNLFNAIPRQSGNIGFAQGHKFFLFAFCAAVGVAVCAAVWAAVYAGGLVIIRHFFGERRFYIFTQGEQERVEILHCNAIHRDRRERNCFDSG
jgi:hypothetical protein